MICSLLYGKDKMRSKDKMKILSSSIIYLFWTCSMSSRSFGYRILWSVYFYEIWCRWTVVVGKKNSTKSIYLYTRVAMKYRRDDLHRDIVVNSKSEKLLSQQCKIFGNVLFWSSKVCCPKKIFSMYVCKSNKKQTQGRCFQTWFTSQKCEVNNGFSKSTLFS